MQFHECVHVAPLAVLVPIVLSSLFYTNLVLPLVVASSLETPFMTPLSFTSPSTFAQSFCHVVAYFP